MTSTKRFLGLLFIIGLSCSSVWAQATAQMSGTVSDPTGALLPGVEVTATQTETGLNRLTVTNETGSYVLANLPLGPYRLEAALPGFQTYVQTGLVLQVGSNPSIGIVLQVGQVTQTIEVQANAALVETRNVSIGQVVETERIVELPLNGRNVQELLLLSGGAVAQNGTAGGGMLYPGRLLISAAGTLGTSTETTLDGITHKDTYDGQAMPFPFPDALAEFRTEIGGQDAKQGQGATVSAVTRSGTNAYHGNLFWFHRNDAFNAIPYYAATENSLKRNQFGGTFGGPIAENRLFFFGGFQRTTIREDSGANRQFVPTDAMMAGDFSTLASAACASSPFTMSYAPNGVQLFNNNVIDPSNFSPIATAVVGRLPRPQDQACGEVTFSQVNQSNESQYVGRVDYQASDDHSLFGRFLYMKLDEPSSFDFTPDNVLNAGDVSQEFQSMGYTAGSTYLISPTTVNSMRLAVSRQTRFRSGRDYFDLSSFGANIYDGYAPNRSRVEIVSGFGLGAGDQWKMGTLLVQAANDVSVSRGSHQIGFGGRVAHSRDAVRFNLGRTTGFTINGQATGHGLGDFLVGSISGANQGTGQQNDTWVNHVNLYIQDTWQMTPRLTVNAGLRWEPILPHIDRAKPVPFVANFDKQKFLDGVRSEVFLNAPRGLVFPGDDGFLQKTSGLGTGSPSANIWQTYWNIWQPRLGLAWDVEGDGRTSVRASYALTYEQYPGNARLGTQTAMAPYGNSQTVIAPGGGLADPWRDITSIHPLTVAPDMAFPVGTDFMPENGDLTPTYVQSWNMSLQREVVQDTLVSASYMGTMMVHLQATNPINLAIFVPGVGDASGNCFLNGQVTHFTVAPGAECSPVSNTQTRRALSFERPEYQEDFGRFGFRDNPGVQQYHAMLISFQRRPTDGVNLSTNYTLSHCTGDFVARSNSGYGSSVVHTYRDPTNRSLDRGNCEMDQRHNFNMTAVLSTPDFSNQTLNRIASDWRLSTIWRVNSAGQAWGFNRSTGLKTLTLGPAATAQSRGGSDVDRCRCNLANQRPNLLLPDEVYLEKDSRDGAQWLNPAAFAFPEPGTLGNLGRANIDVPTFWQFDASLARTINVNEDQSVEIRVEAYNVLNSFRPGAIDTNLNSAQFGRIRRALDMRVLQFALKYAF